MAVPPPETDEDETAIAFGIAAVDGLLDETDLDFPADRQAVETALGNRVVPYDPRGNTVSLTTALEDVEKRQFGSRQELLNALHPVFEARRNGAGLQGWLRSLLPF
ncbi:hypothetical protein RH831_07815 [Halodesulfurarchaeum sp. HSR-GB]|uniref:DUF5789 family protein n=1 Tax=Halodesulfurarchaeum sp. HSR-GB TaxID=3074077 RepID=UPI002864938D|nr:hypothetical protein [Halodesulfurarchaeum sp. HSR-GB]MDR5657086.1 hypothetical protein [Halodesulfurarchaeum sp. HSR-GB]